MEVSVQKIVDVSAMNIERHYLTLLLKSLRSDKTSQVINKVMTPVSAQKTQTQRKINMLTLFTVNFYMSGGK